METYARRALNPQPHSLALVNHELRTAFCAIAHPYTEDTDQEINDLLEVITGTHSPDEQFDPVAHGAFKETYELNYTRGHVVKFCSQQNDTSAERALLHAAEAEGVGFAFIPTYFVDYHGYTHDLPILVDDAMNGTSHVMWVSERSEYTEDPDWEGRYATALEIQPRINSTAAPTGHWNFLTAYGFRSKWNTDTHELEYLPIEEPHFDMITDPNTGEIVPLDTLIRLNIHSKQWIENFLAWYGIKNLEKLADFIQNYHIGDLHNNNLGYFFDKRGNIPVIIDWLSPDSRWISEKTAGLR